MCASEASESECVRLIRVDKCVSASSESTRVCVRLIRVDMCTPHPSQPGCLCDSGRLLPRRSCWPLAAAARRDGTGLALSRLAPTAAGGGRSVCYSQTVPLAMAMRYLSAIYTVICLAEVTSALSVLLSHVPSLSLA